jgi:hypothetical protein
MGQYGNQPDFATRAESINPITDAISSATKLNSAALYVGVGGDLSVIIAGTANPTLADAVVFKGIVAGSFIPVIVDYVLATNTSASEIIALY